MQEKLFFTMFLTSPPSKHRALDRRRLPDDLWTFIFQFSIDSLREWARVQHVCHQLQWCARKPHALVHLEVLLKSADGLDRLGATLSGVRKLEFDFETSQCPNSAPNLTAKPTAKPTSLTELRMGSATDDNMGLLTRVPRLSELFLDEVTRLTNQGLGALSSLTVLHTLSIDGRVQSFRSCAHLSDLTPLAGLSALTSLSLFALGVTDLTPLTHLPLSELFLDENLTLLDLAPLRAMRTLHSLSLQACPMIGDAAVEALSSLASLRTLNLTDCNAITSVGLQGLSSLTSLAVLDVSGTQLTDESLHVLCRSLALEELALQECDITDQGLQALASQTSLHTLDLSFCEHVMDLEPLAQLTSMKKLVLNSCHELTDDSLWPLSGLSQLEQLDLRFDQNTEDCLSFLQALASLQVLHARFRLTDQCLRLMTHFTNLQAVSLSNHVTDAGLRSLSRLVGLTTLDLSAATGVTDDGLAELTLLTNLRTLNLRGVAITDRGLSALSFLTRLQFVDLTDCSRLTCTGFATLSRLVLLQTLKVTGCPHILDKATKLPPFTRLHTFELCGVGVDRAVWLDAEFTALQTLDVSLCAGFDDASLWTLCGLPAVQVCLRVLRMSKCGVTAEGLGALSTLTALREVDLSHSHHVVEAHAKVLATLCVRSLNLENCVEITDQCVRELSVSKTLSYLNLSDCDLITDAGLQALESLRLTKISILNCDRITFAGVENFQGVGLHTDHFRAVEHQPLRTLVQPDPTPPVDMHASEVLRLAMLAYEPRDSWLGRHFFVDRTDDGYVLLNTTVPQTVPQTLPVCNPVRVNVAFEEVNWAFLAWRFANVQPGVHLRWYFSQDDEDDERVRVHARPLSYLTAARPRV